MVSLYGESEGERKKSQRECCALCQTGNGNNVSLIVITSINDASRDSYYAENHADDDDYDGKLIQVIY